MGPEMEETWVTKQLVWGETERRGFCTHTVWRARRASAGSLFPSPQLMCWALEREPEDRGTDEQTAAGEANGGRNEE